MVGLAVSITPRGGSRVSQAYFQASIGLPELQIMGCNVIIAAEREVTGLVNLLDT